LYCIPINADHRYHELEWHHSGVAITMPLPLIQARIFTLLFSSFFLGIHLVSTAICLWTLLVRNPSRGIKLHRGFLAVTLTMAVVGTFNVAVDAVTNIRVWTTGDLGLFTDESEWMNLAKNVNVSVQLLVGDAVLVYRCWIVYEWNVLVVIPSIAIWFGSVAVAILLMVRSADLIGLSAGINAPSLVPITAAQQALTVGLNTITSSLIVFRIWRVSRSARKYVVGQDRLLYVIRVVVESGAIYAVTAIITFSTVLARSTAVYLTADSLVQITGICFNMMIIRFDRNLANRNQAEARPASVPMSSFQKCSRCLAPINGTHNIPRMEIAVSQDMEIDDGSLSGEPKSGDLKVQQWAA